MLKKLSTFLTASALSLFLNSGCVSYKPMDFAYPEAVKSVQNRTENYSLENIVREQNKFYAGASAVEITPSNNQYLAGFMNNRKSTDTLHDLYARSLVLSYNNKTIAIVSLDLIGFMNESVDDIKHLTSKIKGNYVDELIICATHTHSAPDTLGMWGPGLPVIPFTTGVDEEYINFLYDKIVKSIYLAEKNIEEAKMQYASTTLTPEDKISKNVHEEIPQFINRDLNVLKFTGKDNKTIAILTNYSCHPEAFDQKSSVITSDFVHYLNNAVEKSYGGTSIFINHSIGGLITTDSEFNDTSDIKLMQKDAKRIGQTLADKVSITLKSARESESLSIYFAKSKFYVKVNNTMFNLANLLGLIKRDALYDRIKTEVNYLAIGDVHIVTVPGEIFPDVGDEIKKTMSGKINMIFGLANDELGYIMFKDRKDLENVFDYEKTMCVNISLGNVLLEKALHLQKKLKVYK